jgi:hypothetical protein
MVTATGAARCAPGHDRVHAGEGVGSVR